MFLHLIPKPRAALGKRGLSPTHLQGHSGPVPCILSSNTPQLVQGQTPHSPHHCQVTLSLRTPESFWPGLQSLCGHCCGWLCDLRDWLLGTGTRATMQGWSVCRRLCDIGLHRWPGEGQASALGPVSPASPDVTGTEHIPALSPKPCD